MLAAILQAAEERLSVQAAAGKKGEVQMSFQTVNGKLAINGKSAINGKFVINSKEIVNGKKEYVGQNVADAV
jgi:hypothetical protein